MVVWNRTATVPPLAVPLSSSSLRCPRASSPTRAPMPEFVQYLEPCDRSRFHASNASSGEFVVIDHAAQSEASRSPESSIASGALPPRSRALTPGRDQWSPFSGLWPVGKRFRRSGRGQAHPHGRSAGRRARSIHRRRPRPCGPRSQKPRGLRRARSRLGHFLREMVSIRALTPGRDQWSYLSRASGPFVIQREATLPVLFTHPLRVPPWQEGNGSNSMANTDELSAVTAEPF